MSQSFFRIFIVLFAIGIQGSTDHQPTVLIKDTKLIGSLHQNNDCLLYTSPSPRDVEESRMPSSA